MKLTAPNFELVWVFLGFRFTQLIFLENASKVGPFSYKAIFLGSFLFLDALNRSNSQNKLNQFYLNNATGIPYFEDSKKIVNLEKTFFFLDDDQSFKPSLFHHARSINQTNSACSFRSILSVTIYLRFELIFLARSGLNTIDV